MWQYFIWVFASPNRDRGSQYASDHYQRLLAKRGIKCSMMRVLASAGTTHLWRNRPQRLRNVSSVFVRYHVLNKLVQGLCKELYSPVRLIRILPPVNPDRSKIFISYAKTIVITARVVSKGNQVLRENFAFYFQVTKYVLKQAIGALPYLIGRNFAQATKTGVVFFLKRFFCGRPPLYVR